jgi:hypothetical protein
MRYKATVQYYGHYYLSGQVVEGTRISKDDAGVWLLYEDSSEEPEWVLIDASTLEEIEVVD